MAKVRTGEISGEPAVVAVFVGGEIRQGRRLSYNTVEIDTADPATIISPKRTPGEVIVVGDGDVPTLEEYAAAVAAHDGADLSGANSFAGKALPLGS